MNISVEGLNSLLFHSLALPSLFMLWTFGGTLLFSWKNSQEIFSLFYDRAPDLRIRKGREDRKGMVTFLCIPESTRLLLGMMMMKGTIIIVMAHDYNLAFLFQPLEPSLCTLPHHHHHNHHDRHQPTKNFRLHIQTHLLQLAMLYKQIEKFTSQ